MDFRGLKYIVAGAGLFGCVLAERIANGLGQRVAVLDRRDVVGGNCRSERNTETGIEYHLYGTHIFHTSEKKVWDYVTQFASFNSYRHQVLSTHNGKVYQMPVNLETINSFFGKNLRPFEAERFVAELMADEQYAKPENFEQKAVSKIGRELYEAFIRGYTAKQWGKDPRELPPEIFTRLPVRFNYDESYYFDKWQGIPEKGYTALFESILASAGGKIEFLPNTDFFDIRQNIPQDCTVIYSGALDRYYDYRFGKLEWRSLRFEQSVEHVGDWQGTSVMNYADADVPYTRIHEPRHLHPERAGLYPASKTLLIREYPVPGSEADPYYPVSTAANETVAEKYRSLAVAEPRTVIGGRLGDYRYFDMDRTISAALDCYASKILPNVGA